MIFVSSWPARPTNGSPCRSSSAPGASPTNIRSAFGLPTPKTTCVGRACAACSACSRRCSQRSDARRQAQGDRPMAQGCAGCISHAGCRFGAQRRSPWAWALGLTPGARASVRSREMPFTPSSSIQPEMFGEIARVGHGAHRRRRRGAATPSSARRDRAAAATSALDISGSDSSPSGATKRDVIGVDVEAGAGRGDVVGDDEIDALGDELAARGGLRVAGLRREADEHGMRPVAAPAPELGEDVRRPLERRASRAPAFCFSSFSRAGPPAGGVVGDGRGHDDHVRDGARASSRRRASRRRCGRGQLVDRRRLDRGRAGDERHLGAARAAPRRRSQSPCGRSIGCR